MKLLPVGAELFLADERKKQKYMKKLIVVFRNSANALNSYPANVDNMVSS